MTSNDEAVKAAADRLHEAVETARPIIDDGTWPDLDLAQAYAAQADLVGRRLARGERQSGLKLGFTSLAKMAQMGVSEIIAGRLTDAMAVPDGGTLDVAGLIHPRVEPEICFRVARDVDLADGPEALLAAVDAVAPALEVIDSRYDGFSFDLPRVVADNTSAAAYAIGPWSALDRAGIGDLAVSMELTDAPTTRGSTQAILGDPLDALRRLAAIGAAHGFTIHEGELVLAGAATAAAPLPLGTVRVAVATLGEVAITVVDGRTP
ncbi:2-keto-4-pentenoate hydratase [Actinocorallia herbida]|uniref:2-keto-4-pentenoate hydratase n=1 Tax=Actinocorallia herbida TaxID=58109 RepID=UPI000F4B7F9A|nr:fumarylacetoacetate hydrolase family protein [Actinocorallia herbida]